MKSSRSFCNTTLLRKNFTRFAPVWVLYTVCLILGMMLLTDLGLDYHFLSDLSDTMVIMVVVNLCYAPIVVQLLFGDLYNSRMCNAMHAMPMRRETYYVTNLISGLLFSILPTLVMTVLSILLSFSSRFSSGWQIPLYWFVCTNLSYLAFFGIAVFAAFLAGNRLAMASCYGIVNFGSMIAYVLTDTLLTPLLYGVKTWTKPFYALCPVWAMCDKSYLDCQCEYYTEVDYRGVFSLGENWGTLGIYATIGAALLIVGLLLYRRRALECAGDFLAVRALEPVFLVIYTLAVAMCGYLVPEIFMGSDEPIAYVFLFCGLIIGFFTGKMLLARTLRVWNLRALGGCAAVIVGLALTMGITALDPAGIESYMPDADEIDCVVLLPYHRTNASAVNAVNTWGGDLAVASTDAEITRVLRLHEIALEEQLGNDPSTTRLPNGTYRYATGYTLSYRLKDGSTVNRYYYCFTQGEGWNILSRFFNDPKTIFGMEEADFGAFVQNTKAVYINNEWQEMTSEDALSLMQALLADAEAGNLAQNGFHNNNDCGYSFSVEFVQRVPVSGRPSNVTISYENVISDNTEVYSYNYYLSVYTCSENTLRWVQEHYPALYQQMLDEERLYD